MPPGHRINQHECGRIILKFFTESFYSANSLHFPVGKKIGKHLQEMRFTTPKEAGNPNTNVSSNLVEGVAIGIKESHKVLLQVFGDDILIQFLNENVGGILIDFNNAIDFTIDIFLK